jgi:hypothetical protein
VIKVARPAVQLCWPYQSVKTAPSLPMRSIWPAVAHHLHVAGADVEPIDVVAHDEGCSAYVHPGPEEFVGLALAQESTMRKQKPLQVAAILVEYPPEIVDFVCDPRTGLPRRLKWLPTIAEIAEACEHRMEFAKAVVNIRQPARVKTGATAAFWTKEANPRARAYSHRLCKDCEANELFASVDCADRQRDKCERTAKPVVALRRDF